MTNNIYSQPDTYAHGNLPRFDVLRAVAILFVFYFHYTLDFSNELRYDLKTQVLDTHNRPFSAFFFTFFPTAFGGSGVKLFFIISGFLIHYSYLRTGKKKLNFRSYIARRFWRIYPPYLLVLLFFSLFNSYTAAHLFHSKEGILSFVLHLLLLHNLSNSTFFDINSSFWSLALEWQFYLLYPLFLLIRSRIGIRATALILLGFYPVYMIGMGVFCEDFLDDIVLVLAIIPTWGIWGLGAWMAENYLDGKRTFSVSTLALAVFILLYIVGKYFLVWQYTYHLWEALIWAIVVDMYIRKPERELSWWENILLPIGLCSYSFYLIHQPLLRGLNSYVNVFGLTDRFRLLNFVDSVPILLIIFLIAYSLYQFVELPTIAFGKRLQKRHGS